MMKSEHLIVANASSSFNFSILNSLKIKNPYLKITFLDGAINNVVTNNIIMNCINYVIGDLDSIDRSNINIIKKFNIDIIDKPNQNTTDLDKAIEYISSKHPSPAISIINWNGNRIDHTIYNFRIIAKYHLLNISLINQNERIFYVENKTILLTGNQQDKIAILSSPYAEITSYGLEYDMNKFIIEYSKKESTSNSLKNNNAKIIVKGKAIISLDQKIDSQLFD